MKRYRILNKKIIASLLISCSYLSCLYASRVTDDDNLNRGKNAAAAPTDTKSRSVPHAAEASAAAHPGRSPELVPSAEEAAAPADQIRNLRFLVPDDLARAHTANTRRNPTDIRRDFNVTPGYFFSNDNQLYRALQEEGLEVGPRQTPIENLVSLQGMLRRSNDLITVYQRELTKLQDAIEHKTSEIGDREDRINDLKDSSKELSVERSTSTILQADKDKLRDSANERAFRKAKKLLNEVNNSIDNKSSGKAPAREPLVYYTAIDEVLDDLGDSFAILRSLI